MSPVVSLIGTGFVVKKLSSESTCCCRLCRRVLIGCVVRTLLSASSCWGLADWKNKATCCCRLRRCALVGWPSSAGVWIVLDVLARVDAGWGSGVVVVRTVFVESLAG